MSYRLSTKDESQKREPTRKAIGRLLPLLREERGKIAIAFAAILVTSAATLSSPYIIGQTVDHFIAAGDYSGVLRNAALLLGIYVVALFSSYIQTRTMGGVGRRILFNLRNTLFTKLQELPVAFFNQNKAGDLISRINNDTDKLNQFFAQALMQFLANGFLILGSGILLVVLNWRLGGSALLPALAVLITTQAISGWVKRANFTSLQTLGGLSGEIQESLANFKVIVAFNRLDYFRDRFNEANATNYGASVKAGIANAIFIPLYGLAYNIAQLIVLAFGIWMITQGDMTTGLLIGFLLYVTNFYNPLRQLAAAWSSLQLALAALDRISEVLALSSDMPQLEAANVNTAEAPLLEFDHVSFGYVEGRDVLTDISLKLERGRTYALVGPTGGGKTTTASLMARLYDPTRGVVRLEGRDIRTFTPQERAQKIGFILQEPFLFTGTVRGNIVYGNERLRHLSDAELTQMLEARGLSTLLARFDQGLETKVTSSGDSISLGQKQLIAFIRAVLRDPDLLILDEATANIDTVTEQLLEAILDKLPPSTTKVIIAHRLNTISNADDIFFVNAGTVTEAGSMEHAVDLLLHGAMAS
ncbi:MAG TPA: ABC transporter ATP-binding protein [Devosiaceae bacterium]|jgi:ATP-binding cassette subfamily B protein|nr:ABC transporter ATP-binding protein [Devosiaceae bacterium]